MSATTGMLRVCDSRGSVLGSVNVQNMVQHIELLGFY